MFVYAGIDEAGYGPMLGPLLVGRMVLAIPALPAHSPPPQLWQRLAKVVCRQRSARQGRIAINDSKKLYTPGKGDGGALSHLERGVLAFAALAGRQPADVGQWLDCLGEQSHHDLSALPWYAPGADRPWQALPCACTQGEIAVARAMLAHGASRIGVQALDLGAAVVFEDRFNSMVAATRSKASASFTFVASHLRFIWDRFGEHGPYVAVDRQSGRMRYRELLAWTFPEASISVLDETPSCSAYSMEGPSQRMHVRFEVEAERRHMPVALASMISKYTRELLMARFQAWFTHHAPGIKPTAGYATDARRFLEEIRPLLPAMSIQEVQLVRSC